MRILVIGDGKVGKEIIAHTCQEGHEVVVVDKNPKVIEQMVNQYDVMGICGNGASYDILKKAEADKMDLVIAATSSDETNILSCLVANKLGALSTIARVRNYEYNNQMQLIKDGLGITMTINPELEAANEISRIMNFPEAIRVDTFAKGLVDLVEIFIPENSPIIGQTLLSIHQKYQVQVLICAVQRGDKVFIPTGNFVLMPNDKIHIAANKANLRQFINKLGLMDQKIKKVLIIGGGKIALYLAEDLIKNKYYVKIIENDYNRCLELSDILKGATIIHGDGSDQTILEEEGLNEFDSVICLTGIDEENIIISMYAKKQNIRKIVTKVDRSSFANLLETIGSFSVISPKELTASRIVSYVRAIGNSRGNKVETLYKLVNNRVEAIEFIAKEGSIILNTPLKDLKTKKDYLVAAIIHEGKTIIPGGDDVISANDSVIIVTTNCYLSELEDIME